MLRCRLAGCGALLAAVWAGSPAIAQLRVVQYNIGAEVRSGTATIFNGIAAQAKAGIAKRPDIIMIQEMDSYATDGQALVNALNTAYGVTTYSRGTLDVATAGGGRPGVVYNSSTVQLIAQTGIGTLSGTGNARQTLRAQFRLAGYGSSTVSDLYMYVSHFKASDTADDRARRNVEATSNRANADALAQGTNIIMGGDFNLYTSTEAAWTTLTAAGNGQMFDPINRVGNWNNNASFRDVHTQSPTTTALYGGQVTGGVDDRFDFQLISNELQDAEGLAYIPNTYRAFGNNNTHSLNGNITTGNGADTSAAILTALQGNSDHLPVVADYQIPARMTVAALTPLPTRVLRNSVLSVPISTTNSASVVAANGADELDYTITGSGAASGSVNGTVSALAGADVKNITVSTATAGSNTATFTVTATSQGVPDAAAVRSGTFVVVDGSNGSFSPSADTNQRVIDFGVLRVGDVVGTSQSVALYARAAASGFTADLAVTSVRRRQESTGGLTITAAPLASLAAGASNTFTASVDTTIARTLDVTYQFALADAATVSGGTATQAPLTLDLAAKITSFADLARGTGNAPTPAPAITAPWSPDQMPSLSFPEPLTVGQVTLSPDSLFASVPQFQIDLTGSPNALAAVLSDWTLDGSIHGYTVTPLDADSLILTYSPSLLGDTTLFSWNLTGTNATLAQITSIPEPVGLILSLPLVALLRRRR